MERPLSKGGRVKPDLNIFLSLLSYYRVFQNLPTLILLGKTINDWIPTPFSLKHHVWLGSLVCRCQFHCFIPHTSFFSQPASAQPPFLPHKGDPGKAGQLMKCKRPHCKGGGWEECVPVLWINSQVYIFTNLFMYSLIFF